MKKITKTLTKIEHEPGCSCSICGNYYNVISFKNGYVCEPCLDYIKESYEPDTDSDIQHK